MAAVFIVFGIWKCVGLADFDARLLRLVPGTGSNLTRKQQSYPKHQATKQE